MAALALTIPRTSSPEPSPPSPYPSPYPSSRLPPPSPPPSPPPPASSTATPASTALCTPSSSASSRSSLPVTTAASSSLSVKFAPLPQIAPRKRRSAAPLGMAARGSLVRGRRGAPPLDDLPPHDPQHPDGSDGPEALSLAERRWLQEEAAARHAHIQGTAYAQLARATEAETAAEEAARAAKAAERAARIAAAADADGVDAEPLLALGRKVTRHFWRRRTASATRPGSAPGSSEPAPPVPALRHRKSADAPLRPILATLATNVTPNGGAREHGRGYVPYPGARDAAGSEESSVAPGTEESPSDAKHESDQAPDGSVPAPATPAHEEEDPLGASREWAAALDADIPEDIGQTQTIVEGRAVKAPTSDDGHEDDSAAAAP